jgi:hypothetical protein
LFIRKEKKSMSPISKKVVYQARKEQHEPQFGKIPVFGMGQKLKNRYPI